MLELDVSPLGPLGDLGQADLVRWASSGRSPVPFEGLLHAVLRARFMRAALAGSFGGEVEAGLSRDEESSILALAAHRPVDAAQSAAKRLALGPQASADPSDLVGAMVRAALAHDAHASRGRRRALGPSVHHDVRAPRQFPKGERACDAVPRRIRFRG